MYIYIRGHMTEIYHDYKSLNFQFSTDIALGLRQRNLRPLMTYFIHVLHYSVCLRSVYPKKQITVKKTHTHTKYACVFNMSEFHS